jgi:hypothetical protein
METSVGVLHPLLQINNGLERSYEGWKLNPKACYLSDYDRLERSYEGWKQSSTSSSLYAQSLQRRLERSYEGWKPFYTNNALERGKRLERSYEGWKPFLYKQHPRGWRAPSLERSYEGWKQ